MTKEELNKKMEEAYASAAAHVAEYNKAVIEEDDSAAKKASNALTESLSEYASHAKKLHFKECGEAEDAMLEAIRVPTYAIIRDHDKKVEGSEIKIKELVPRDVRVDLLELGDYLGGIGAVKTWEYTLEKFNFHVNLRVSDDIGVPITEQEFFKTNYAMSQMAAARDLGKDPVSNTTIIKTMDILVKEMVGDKYHVTKKDANFLLLAYADLSKKKLGTLTSASHKKLRDIMLNVLGHVVYNRPYHLECKTVKAETRETTAVAFPKAEEPKTPAKKSKPAAKKTKAKEPKTEEVKTEETK